MRFTPATGDQFVVKEVLIDEVYAFDFKKDDIVLNLWGNIWSFDVYAYDRVKTIITYEPDPKAFSELQWHLKENNITNVIAYNEAIAPYIGQVPIIIGNESGHNSCIIAGQKWDCVKVPCNSLQKAIEDSQCTKIKCDIEGFEYAIFEGIILPMRVNEIWLETHTFSVDQRNQHEKLCQDLAEQGYNVSIFKNDEYNRTFLVKAKR